MTRQNTSITARPDLRVLVVDDQEQVRTWVRRVLLSAGISDVTEAVHGRDAFEKITVPGNWFDLILCDLRMPERDGIETIHMLASLGTESALVIMSGEDERVVESAGVFANMNGLHLLGTLAKPLTVEKLEPLLAGVHPMALRPATDRETEPTTNVGDAFLRNELFMMYQPKVSLRTGGFAGVEALVRWRHPELGIVQPARFVPQMEESDDHSAALVRFVSMEAIACAGRWMCAGRELKMAINLPARAFDELDLPERLLSHCGDAGVPPFMITLEVTETQVARDALRMLEVATRLRLKGFSLSIDDFGTGHSGLAALQRLPFNEIKIDRQFVHGCSTSASARSVVEASLALARSLKMNAVAEGVQDRADWDLLVQLGCDTMQGFFVARPMTEEGLEAWQAQWAARAVVV